MPRPLHTHSIDVLRGLKWPWAGQTTTRTAPASRYTGALPEALDILSYGCSEPVQRLLIAPLRIAAVNSPNISSLHSAVSETTMRIRLGFSALARHSRLVLDFSLQSP
ncbi:MAG TPA: hypothetical protein EYP33_04105 [Pyrodictium sp.]|nr:hypothetical protein [Pyrodictium sp.]